MLECKECMYCEMCEWASDVKCSDYISKTDFKDILGKASDCSFEYDDTKEWEKTEDLIRRIKDVLQLQ